MKGEPRLSGFEQVGQVTDALLALTQAVNDPQPGFVAERVEPPRGLLQGVLTEGKEYFGGGRRHGINVSINFDVSSREIIKILPLSDGHAGKRSPSLTFVRVCTLKSRLRVQFQ